MIKNELQHIIRGTYKDSESTLIETVANYLRASARASTVVENYQQNKQEKTKRLIEICNVN